MALKSTIYKANLSLSDIDHGHYEELALTIARHPSETDERMMIRLLALALNAYLRQTLCQGDGSLGFGAGLSDPDDPDVILRDYSGQARLWIEVGQPEDRPIIKACNKADAVRVYCFSSAAEIWWKGIENKLTRLNKLEVWRVPTESSQALASLASRSMQLQVMVHDGTVTVSTDAGSVSLELERWM